MLADTMAVIPDTKNRLNAAYCELLSLIVRHFILPISPTILSKYLLLTRHFAFLQEICSGDESIVASEDWTAAQNMKKTLDEMFE